MHTISSQFLINGFSLIPGVSPLPTAGRLPLCLHNWLRITSDQWVIQAVKGYKLELMSTPFQNFPPRPESQGPPLNGGGDTEAHGQGCSEESHLLCESIHQPDLFLVPKKDGSARLVINLRPLNRFIHQLHFKMESLGMIRDLLREGDWMASIDLKDAYLSGHNMARSPEVSEIPMAGQSVRVSVPSFWSEQCTTCLHQTTETCTCKASPPGHQTDNVLRRYVGDGTEQGGTRESLIPDNISSRVVRFCGQQGEVSIGTSPGDSLPWFHGGLQGDEDQAVRREGDTNFDSLQEDQGEGIYISERIGQINWQDDSNPAAIFPAPLWYRELQHLKNQTYQRSQSFETTMTLNQEALLELDWWSIRRNLMDGKSVSTQEPDLTMETDASMLGWGAVCQGIRTGGLWSQMERKNHINCLELLAAWFGVKALAKDRRNIHIHLRMDNRTAVFYVVNRMGGGGLVPRC